MLTLLLAAAVCAPPPPTLVSEIKGFLEATIRVHRVCDVANGHILYVTTSTTGAVSITIAPHIPTTSACYQAHIRCLGPRPLVEVEKELR